MSRVVLASTSPFRRALLDRLGLAYDAVPPVFEEIAPPGLSPLACALLFAEGKALSLAHVHPGAVIVGADQALDVDGELLRKPATLDEAAEQLERLAGRVHALHTAVAVHAPPGLTGVSCAQRMVSEVVTVELRVRPLSRAQIRRYVELDRPIGSAGGYLFERHGAWLFDEVRHADETAIVGLPLVPLCRLLRGFGIDPLEVCAGG
ncbi:septum formation inhibitor Maf [Sorangium cellulosum]|uniref:7-methyl-GTP pyrophosphatase n=1 Tax=Sorangium cellulosum TaxID=56 RepID=A0A2L0EJA5_SORCE|nr:Maf family protein [Sorangium cellulosum]AUX39368.1 septum formation inhibitor Maf [Sorangium cellulosum]